MSVSKRFNAFVGRHNQAVGKVVVLFYIVFWFIGGVLLIDRLDPYLFIAIWMPLGALAAAICYKW
jgi:hypothetical protein